jgi:5-methylcytosine-specific restriction endonuclease McrA
VQSFCPVRELSPGERPRDWVVSGNEGANDFGIMPPDTGEASEAPGSEFAAPARVDAVAADLLSPERYKVQFTATAEYVRLVDEAKALLSHAVPQAPLEEIHLRAMRALVSELKKKKYAAKKAATPRESDPKPASPHGTSAEHDAFVEPGRACTKRRGARTVRGVPREQPRQRGRHVPAAVRRAVFERDGNQCTYTADTGMRCPETHRLEFHHLTPFAVGGEHDVSNIALRCVAHNALAAEEDFGRELVEEKKGSSHEPAAKIRDDLERSEVEC